MNQDAVLLSIIAGWTEATGRPPTIRECAEELGCTPAEVRSLLTQLRAEGFVTKVPGQNAIEIAQP